MYVTKRIELETYVNNLFLYVFIFYFFRNILSNILFKFSGVYVCVYVCIAKIKLYYKILIITKVKFYRSYSKRPFLLKGH